MTSIASEKNNQKHYEKKCKEVDDAVKKAEIELRNFQQILQVITYEKIKLKKNNPIA